MVDSRLKGLFKMDARVIALTLLMWGWVLLLPVGTAFAQGETNGLISGRVIDQQGAPIPGANVTATNQLTTARQITSTNESGYFIFPEVLPGTYTLSIEKEGFEKLEQTGIVLISADRLSAGTLQLKIGSTRVIVTVSSETTPVQTTSSEQSAVITESQMAALPSIGRDYMALTRTIPGSNYLTEGGANILGAGSGASFGGVPQITGVDINTNGVFSSISNVSGDQLPTVMDNIQDLKVLTYDYEPQYGKVEGAVMNITTKSGTTAFHGGVYYYLRNEALNASDYFNNRLNEPKSRYRYNTFGGTLGGPVYGPGPFEKLKNKLFFFFLFDDEPSTVPEGPRTYLMPTAAERLGNFSQSLVPGTTTPVTVLDPLSGQPFQGMIVPTSRQNATMQTLLSAYPAGVFPLPNFTNRAISSGNYNYVINDSNNDPTNQESVRMDYAASEKLHMFARWQRTYDAQTGRASMPLYEGWQNGTMTTAAPNWRVEFNATYTINPHMVNNIAMGYEFNRGETIIPTSTLSQFQQATYGVNFPSPYPQNNPLGILPYMTFTYGPTISYDARLPGANTTDGWSVADNFNAIYKNHQLKFGIYTDLELQNQNHHAGNGKFSGQFSFTDPDPSDPYNAGYSYAEALLGDFDSYTIGTARVDDKNTARTLEWYAQDDWRVRKRLSLNFGARFTKDIPQGIAGSQGSQLLWSTYQASDAPPLFQPVLVNGKSMTEDPVNGAVYPAAYLNKFVPGVGNPAPGAVSVGQPNWPGLFYSQGIKIQPRFGFAYDVFGNGKMAIRGGIGSYYSQRTYSGTVYSSIINPPTIETPTEYYGTVAGVATGQGVLGPSNMYVTDLNAPLPRDVQWSLGVEREIGSQSLLNVYYVGMVEHNNPYSFNYNSVPYGAEFLPQNIDPATGTVLPDNYFRPYPGYASITENLWGDNGNYNALQMNFTRRMSHGLAYGIAYTWSKNLDDNRSSAGHFIPGSLSYGPSSTNMANRLVPNWVWDLPKASGHWNNLFSRRVLDHWQVSGIAMFVSGVPASISLSTTNGENITGGGDGAKVIRLGNAVLPKSQRTFNQFFNTGVWALPAVNPIGAATGSPAYPHSANYIGNGWSPEIYGPGMNNWDIAVSKNIHISKERVTGQLRCEMYNTWNHPSFSSVNTTADFNPATGAQVNGAFGQLTADRQPRIIQVALRISF